MSELERELRGLRDRVAEDVRPSPEMAGVVFRRARVRRVLTAVTGTLVIVAIGLSAFVAVGAFSDREPQLPIGPSPSEDPAPTETPVSEVGRDIGLGFPVCDISRLRGVDLLGDGADGAVWTATTLGGNGKCRREIEDSYLVAADVTGDGLADALWEALPYCVMCRPFGATDLNGDGADELVIVMQGGSVTQYGVFAAQETPDGSIEFGPVLVAEPGNRRGGFRVGEITSLWIGGDEGFSGAIACEGYPEDPVLVFGWSNHAVEGPEADITEVHLIRLAMRDGAFEVLDALNLEQPTDDPMPEGFPTGTEGCGLDFDPFR